MNLETDSYLNSYLDDVVVAVGRDYFVAVAELPLNIHSVLYFAVLVHYKRVRGF